jgi:hypothetical protein
LSVVFSFFEVIELLVRTWRTYTAVGGGVGESVKKAHAILGNSLRIFVEKFKCLSKKTESFGKCFVVNEICPDYPLGFATGNKLFYVSS